MIFILLGGAPAYSQGGNIGSNSSPVVNRQGIPLPGVNVSVCQPLTTTSASVTNNIATFVMSSNPQTAGFVAGMQIMVTGFTGGDAYLNAGTLTNGTITGGYTVLAVTSTQIQFDINHANAVASTTGSVLQQGNAATSCGGLVSVYADPALTVLVTQPFQTDQLGNWNVFDSPGVYFVQFYSVSTGTTIKQIVVGTSGGGGGSGPCSITGSVVSCPLSVAVATGNGFAIQVPNNGTGTSQGLSVSYDSSGNAQTTANGATAGSQGICIYGCGNTGTATILQLGLVQALFDNTTVVNDYAVIGANGQLHDAGATLPTGVQVLGQVRSVNTGAGTFAYADIFTGSYVANTAPSGTTYPVPLTPTPRTVVTGLNAPDAVSNPGQLRTAIQGQCTNPQASTYTIAATDFGCYVESTGGSPQTFTIPDAGTSGFGSGFYFIAYAFAQPITLQRTSVSVFLNQGSSTSYTLPVGQSAVVWSPDNVNWNVLPSGTGSSPVTQSVPVELLVNGASSATSSTLHITKNTETAAEAWLSQVSNGQTNIVQSAVANCPGSCTTVSVTLPSNVATGDAIALLIAPPTTSSPTVGDSLSNSFTYLSNTGNYFAAYTCASVGSGSDTLTLTAPSGIDGYSVIALELTGVASSGCADQFNAGSSSLTVSTSSPVTQSTELVLGWFSCVNCATQSYGPGSGYTSIRQQQAYTTIFAEAQNQTSSLSGVQTATATTISGSATPAILTLKLVSTGQNIPIFQPITLPYLPVSTQNPTPGDYVTWSLSNGNYIFNDSGVPAPGLISAGTISIASATSGSHSFTTSYGSAPVCTATPSGTTPPGTALSYAVSSSTGSVTITLSASGTASFNWSCKPASN